MRVLHILPYFTSLLVHAGGQTESHSRKLGPNWQLTTSLLSDNETVSYNLTSTELDKSIKGYKIDLIFQKICSNCIYNVIETPGTSTILKNKTKVTLLNRRIDPTANLGITLTTNGLINEINHIQDFYFNEFKVCCGESESIYTSYNIDHYRKGCSMYVKSSTTNSPNQVAFMFHHTQSNEHIGVTVHFIFGQEIQTIESPEMQSTLTNRFEWKLQNLGWEIKRGDNVSLNMVLTSTSVLYYPEPIGIVFNGEILCGLPSDRVIQLHNSESIVMTTRNLTIVCVFFIVVLAVSVTCATILIFILLLRIHIIRLRENKRSSPIPPEREGQPPQGVPLQTLHTQEENHHHFPYPFNFTLNDHSSQYPMDMDEIPEYINS